MASQLRWILVAIFVPLLIGIWWWGTRRSRQAPGNPQLRESNFGAAVPQSRSSGPSDDDPGVIDARAGTRYWGVSPLEPLSIRTTDFEPVEVVKMPMRTNADPLEETLELGVAEREHAASMYVGAPQDAAAEPSMAEAAGPLASTEPVTGAVSMADVADTGAHDVGNAGAHEGASQTQLIITIRVGAAGDARWSGSVLAAALEHHGLAYGRYQVFHRKHSDGRTLFCAASLVEPGTFDLAKMQGQEFRGLTLFAVLPGPLGPMETFNEFLSTAGELAKTLHGSVQDSKGVPLSRQSAEALRADVERFRAMQTMS